MWIVIRYIRISVDMVSVSHAHQLDTQTTTTPITKNVTQQNNITDKQIHTRAIESFSAFLKLYYEYISHWCLSLVCILLISSYFHPI